MQAKRGEAVRKPAPSQKLGSHLAAQLRQEHWFSAGLRIGVGLSGGADSVALLTLLAELRSELGIVVSVVHFNHKLRGKASDADEKFVGTLAEKFGMTLHIGRGDVASKAKREKANLEDAARRARYEFFERLAIQGAVDVIATAHTMDDQAETVLAHIMRGTGIAGLAGIHPMSGRVVRPLLSVRRVELRNFLRATKQKWREDASNHDFTKTRARMRKKLFPLLEKQFNPAVVEHLGGLAKLALEQSSFVEQLVAELIGEKVKFEAGGARIKIASLLNPLELRTASQTEVLAARFIQQIVNQVKSKNGQLTAVHLEAVMRIARTGEPGKRLQLPGGVDVVRERDALIFRPREK